MVSDQAQALERDNIFIKAESRKLVKIREQIDKNDVVPQIICQNKPVKECEPDFFVVNIAHGEPKSNKFNVIKNSDFPIENRSTVQTMNDIKNYLKKNNQKSLSQKYSDFHLLLFLAK